MIARSHYLLYKAIKPSVCFSVCMSALFDVMSRTLLLYTRLSQSWNADETPNFSLCVASMVDAWTAGCLGFKSPMGSNFFCILSSRL